jgi:hypothetical protein
MFLQTGLIAVILFKNEKNGLGQSKIRYPLLPSYPFFSKNSFGLSILKMSSIISRRWHKCAGILESQPIRLPTFINNGKGLLDHSGVKCTVREGVFFWN